MDYDYRNKSGPSYARPMYGYPNIGQQSGHGHQFFPLPERNQSFQQHNSSPFPFSSSSLAGLGIKVTLKPQYRITPPPQLLPRAGDIPRCGFQFDFGIPMQGVDPLVMKYTASGLNREAVNIAVANYGDDPTKVQEFANGFAAMREMGFPTNAVAEALFMFDNDTDKALSHLLHRSS
ncbi:hypothetical protein HID58_038184 [Brassica napus]|uniref:UBA domain-containing protein n=1 Tax=Brassica napus TaxID=3708 RepID=A0ABQ8BNI3_BRANA|nr:hypothetical protein HID58_038184 [Brassica napus]